MTRTFAVYALSSIVVVAALGFALAASYRTEARHRGVAEGRSEALLVAETAIEPILDGRPLGDHLSPAETSELERLVARSVRTHNVLRLRLRDLSGNVVFSDDGSGFGDKPEDEAVDAAHGTIVARLTHLNSDSNDSGPAGPEAVEVYVPLVAGNPARRVGVMEVYLPYAPINVDVTAGLHELYIDLALGLGALYLILFALSVSLSRGLRQQLTRNKFLAEHDLLTDLPNRVLFHRCAKAAVESALRDGTRTALAIVDLDRFKEINDTLGHHNGDELLTKLARRLAEFTRPEDAVARLGGDEFGVILSGVSDPEDVLRRLRIVIENDVEVSGLPLSTESSMGYVVIPEDGTDVDELLQRADVAMYVAKAQHAGVVRYDPALDHYNAANLGLIADLRHAIDNDELVLHYQPKVTLPDGEVDAVEALVRWQHPTHGLLYPDRFIPLAEQTDLMEKLTRWVTDRALSDMSTLGSEFAHVRVSVNASARNICHAEFATQVIDALRDHRMSAHRLMIEITETALLTDPARAALTLAALAAVGVGVSIDDFGIGQTSLGFLSSLPVHELKIDKGFVTDMMSDPGHAAIVRSIIDLAHNLSLHVVAEGVETDDVLDALREADCDLAQGYLFARPMSLADLRPWLTEVERTRPAPVR
ncbi:MAG TPA: bifunctional diguanylate cyclase/phosphodiesterase [Acidimicrobiales bacterium]|nr:bifunctional diguanylate cyclase/phosphodiesterase [Acidimicrobiales bacterium]